MTAVAPPSLPTVSLSLKAVAPPSTLQGAVLELVCDVAPHQMRCKLWHWAPVNWLNYRLTAHAFHVLSSTRFGHRASDPIAAGKVAYRRLGTALGNFESRRSLCSTGELSCYPSRTTSRLDALSGGVSPGSLFYSDHIPTRAFPDFSFLSSKHQFHNHNLNSAPFEKHRAGRDVYFETLPRLAGAGGIAGLRQTSSGIRCWQHRLHFQGRGPEL